MTDKSEGRGRAARRKSASQTPLEQISQGIASGVAERTHVSTSFQNDVVERVTFNNGVKAIEKKITHNERADAEALTSLFGRAINAPVPAVLKTSPNKVYIQLMPGEIAALRLESEEAALPYVRSFDGLMLGFLDAAAANIDRHSANWLIHARPHGGDRIYGIDHANMDTGAGIESSDGRRLILPAEGSAISPFAHYWFLQGESRSARFAGHWSAQGELIYEAWKDNQLHHSDVARVIEKVAPLGPKFINRGHGPWWQAILGRLEAIQFHAKGETPWFDSRMTRKLTQKIQTNNSQSWTRRGSVPRSSSPRTVR